MFNASFFEAGNDIHPIFFQQDADTDITGDWINMKHYDRATILFVKAGTEDVTNGAITINQASDSSGTGSKALTCSRCWYKTGTMTGQGAWTEVDVGTGTPDNFLAFGASVPTGATRVVDDVNTNALYLACEIQADRMDSENGFEFFTLFIESDDYPASAILVSAFAILHGARYPQKIPVNPLS